MEKPAGYRYYNNDMSSKEHPDDPPFVPPSPETIKASRKFFYPEEKLNSWNKSMIDSDRERGR